mmetsp:Transcript_82713/g.124157  ORF Transcript_82713/g.124157 Transcript_82713/m.124157 type:complete len:92 (-) Transcript_82713:139-414(-)
MSIVKLTCEDTVAAICILKPVVLIFRDLSGLSYRSLSSRSFTRDSGQPDEPDDDTNKVCTVQLHRLPILRGLPLFNLQRTTAFWFASMYEE